MQTREKMSVCVCNLWALISNPDDQRLYRSWQMINATLLLLLLSQNKMKRLEMIFIKKILTAL